jgi:hypothetical protein
MAKILLNERRSETIKPSSHRRMGREKISRMRSGQRHFKRLRIFLHETAGTLQHREGCMTFIQVADIRMDVQRRQQSPAANSQQHFLREARLRSAAI